MMGIVYEPADGHVCHRPDKRHHQGAIWKCDECYKYWHFTCVADSWGPVWAPVRWWNFVARHRIRHHENPASGG